MLKPCGRKWKVLGVGRNYGQQKYGVEKLGEILFLWKRICESACITFCTGVSKAMKL